MDSGDDTPSTHYLVINDFEMNNNKDSTATFPASRNVFDFLQEKIGERKTRTEAYCDLMAKAAVGFVSPFLKKRGPKLKPNQCHVTVSELSVEWKWHRATVRTFLDKLEELGQIKREKLTQSFVITMPAIDNAENADIGNKDNSFVQDITPVLYEWQSGNLSDEELANELVQLIEVHASCRASADREDSTDSTSNHGMQRSETMPGIDEEESQQTADKLRQLAMALLGRAAISRTLDSYARKDITALTDYFEDDCDGDWERFIVAAQNLTDFILTGQYDGMEEQSPLEKRDFQSLRLPFSILIARSEAHKGRL